MKTKHLQIGRAGRYMLLLLMLPLMAAKAYAYDFSAVCSTGQTLYYNITDNGNHLVELTCPGTNYSPWGSYTKPTGNITIPSTVTYNDVAYTVAAIGDDAFYNCSGLTGSLTIPNSVTEIEDYAFYYCYGFTGSLTIPNSVTYIGEGAFEDCGFTGSLTIPNSVTEIGDYAFAYCTNLQFLQVEAFNPPIIGNNTFEDVNKAIPVTVPCGSLSAYQTAPYWRDFTNIREGTGVEENDAASSANFACISNGELVISCEGKNTLHIFDMMGRVLSSQTINGDCRISANRMTAGTYILNLNGMAQKIVVK